MRHAARVANFTTSGMPNSGYRHFEERGISGSQPTTGDKATARTPQQPETRCVRFGVQKDKKVKRPGTAQYSFC